MNNKNYLYGLTVQGIQSYIFSTNKLKEIIGASEIIEKLCTQWFEEFITKETIKGTKLLNAAGNIRFLTTEQNAKKIYRDFPFFLKDKAVGVPYSQAVEENNNDAIYNLDVKLRAQRNIPIQDFDLGIMLRGKESRTGSSLFKTECITDGKEIETLTFNKETYTKYKNSKPLYKNKNIRLTEKTKITVNDISYLYPNEFETIAKNGKDSWLALVHIDGNGMGTIIKSIISKSDNPFKDLAEFSENVEKSTLEAYKKSVKDIIVPNAIIEKEDSVEEHILPFRPIVLGGDDLTVIMRADLAITFVKNYLENFEEETKKYLGKIKKEGLTACAGIAFIKEKFPFHYSSTLAEDLCKYAKNQSNREYSCLTFYRVQDSFINSYEEIIERELKDSKVFNLKPYTTKDIEGFKTINSLLNDINSLKNEDAPTGTIRKKVDAYLNGFINDEELKAPLKNYDKNLAEKSNYFIDYLTLLAVGTKN